MPPFAVVHSFASFWKVGSPDNNSRETGDKLAVIQNHLHLKHRRLAAQLTTHNTMFALLRSRHLLKGWEENTSLGSEFSVIAPWSEEHGSNAKGHRFNLYEKELWQQEEDLSLPETLESCF